MPALMELLEKMRERARSCSQRLVLFEGEEDRVLIAAEIIAREGLSKITLPGRRECIYARAHSGSSYKAEDEIDFLARHH